MKNYLACKNKIVSDHLFGTNKSLFKSLMMSIVLGAVIFLLTGSNAYATTVRAMTVGDVLRHSSLVFEGKVISASSKRTGLKGRIHTLVTFQVIEVISGHLDKKVLTLSYMGGMVNGVKLQVGNMMIPKVGDEGVFFVESLSRLQVHPLTGWGQGHFVIKKDLNGKEKVLTSRGLTVKGLVKGRKESKFIISRGVAVGVEVGVGDNLNNAMTLSEFKIKLKQIMEEIK